MGNGVAWHWVRIDNVTNSIVLRQLSMICHRLVCHTSDSGLELERILTTNKSESKLYFACLIVTLVTCHKYCFTKYVNLQMLCYLKSYKKKERWMENMNMCVMHSCLPHVRALWSLEKKIFSQSCFVVIFQSFFCRLNPYYQNWI